MTGPGARWPSAILPPRRAAALAAGLRHGVPVAMIDQVADRCRAGDWRGGCAVSGVDVRIDLGRVRRRAGRVVHDALLDDLRTLRPDLLRWHLPREGHGDGLLRPGLVVPLSVHGPDDVALVAFTPPVGLRAGQRLVLSVVGGPGGRHLEPSAEALLAVLRGGSGSRYDLSGHPGHWRTDVSPQPADLPVAPTTVTELQDSGQVLAAWAAAGVPLRTALPAGARQDAALRRLARVPVDLPHLARRARATSERRGTDRDVAVIRPGGGLAVRLTGLAADGPLVAELLPARWAVGLPVLPWACWGRRVDHELVRTGFLEPHEVHHLARPLGDPDQTERQHLNDRVIEQEPVEVVCAGRRHRVLHRDGRWQAVDHGPAGDDGTGSTRDQLFELLGGRPAACLQVVADLTGVPIIGDVHPVEAVDAVQPPDPGRQEAFRLRLLLAGVVPARFAPPADTPSLAGAARPGRRSRKGDPTRTHK